MHGRGHQEIPRDDGMFDLRTSFTNVWIERDGGCPAPCNSLELLSAYQFYQDYITAMRESDFREGQFKKRNWRRDNNTPAPLRRGISAIAI